MSASNGNDLSIQSEFNAIRKPRSYDTQKVTVTIKKPQHFCVNEFQMRNLRNLVGTVPGYFSAVTFCLGMFVQTVTAFASLGPNPGNWLTFYWVVVAVSLALGIVFFCLGMRDKKKLNGEFDDILGEWPNSSLQETQRDKTAPRP